MIRKKNRTKIGQIIAIALFSLNCHNLVIEDRNFSKTNKYMENYFYLIPETELGEIYRDKAEWLFEAEKQKWLQAFNHEFQNIRNAKFHNKFTIVTKINMRVTDGILERIIRLLINAGSLYFISYDETHELELLVIIKNGHEEIFKKQYLKKIQTRYPFLIYYLLDYDKKNHHDYKALLLQNYAKVINEDFYNYVLDKCYSPINKKEIFCKIIK